MSAEYILTKSDLYTLLGFKFGKVDRGLTWFYTPNSNFNGKSPKEAADCEDISFEECEAAFNVEFGDVELVVPYGMFSLSQLTAIFKKYPKTVEKEM